MKRIHSLLATLVVAAALAGCSKPSPLVGTWNAKRQTTSIDITFNADGTCQQRVTGKMVKKDFAMTTKGKYTLEGKKLIMTMDSVSFEGFPEEIKKGAEKGFNDEGKGKPQEGSVEFKGNDELTIMGFAKDAGPELANLTLKRVK